MVSKVSRAVVQKTMSEGYSPESLPDAIADALDAVGRIYAARTQERIELDQENVRHRRAVAEITARCSSVKERCKHWSVTSYHGCGYESGGRVCDICDGEV